MDESPSLDGLANVLRALRIELDAAQKNLAESGKEPLLFLKGAEVELAFTMEKSASGKGGIKFKVWGLEIGGDADVARKSTVVHRIKIDLEPGADTTKPPTGPSSTSSVVDLTTSTKMFYFSREEDGIVIRDNVGKRKIGMLSRPNTGDARWGFDPDLGHCRLVIPGLFLDKGRDDAE